MISLRSNLRQTAVPLFIEILLVMTLGAVDTFMLSRFSDNSVAAVGVVNQIIYLIFLVFEVISLGTSILCSQYRGAKRNDLMIQTVGVSLITNTVLGIVVSALLYSFTTPILQLMGLRYELMSAGREYMHIVGSMAFIQAISLTISASLRAAGKAKYPMYVTLMVNITNIIGNYVLIFGKFGFPQMGVEGAAISTVISRIIAMLILIIILRKKLIPHFPKKYFTPFPWKELRNLLHIGIPSAGEQMSYSLSQVIITYFINMISNEALTARTYCVNIVMFVYLFASAFGQGGAIEIGHLVGAHRPRAAYLMGSYVMRLAISVSLSLSVATAFSGRAIMEVLTSNPEIIAMGVAILWVDIFVEFGRAINIFAVNALRSAGDIYFPVTIGIIVMWAISVIGSYLFGITFGWGILGMWAAFALDEVIRGIIFIWRWRSMKWADKHFI